MTHHNASPSEDNRHEIEKGDDGHKIFVGGRSLYIQLHPDARGINLVLGDVLSEAKASRMIDALQQFISNSKTGNRSWNGFR